MRFTLLIASAFAALATAQSTTSSSSRAAGSTTATTTHSLTPVESCAAKCTAGDVTCQAACYGVPYPSASVMNQTTECVADCDQGNGTPAQNSAYAQCRDRCISSYILTSTLGTVANGAEATGAAGSDSTSTTGGSATGSSSESASTTGSESSSPSSSESSSASGAAASSSSSGIAAAYGQVAAPMGGLAGLIMALLAL